MRPSLTRLTLPRINASSLARYIAVSIWLSVTPSSLLRRAMLPSVSPFFTVSCLAPAAGLAGAAGMGRASVRGAGAVGVGTATGAGFAAGAEAAAGLGARYSGGSSRKVYSRTRRPVDHCNSIRTSRKGSLTGCKVLSRMTGRPPRLSIASCRPISAGLSSMPAWRNASGDASLADRESSSPGCSETISISALSGWPSAEVTASLPSPAE